MENKLTLINVLFCYIPLGAVAIAVLLVLSAVVARVESEPADSDSRPPRSRRASRTTPAGTVDDVTAGPAPKGPELPAGTRLKKIELKGCRGIFEVRLAPAGSMRAASPSPFALALRLRLHFALALADPAPCPTSKMLNCTLAVEPVSKMNDHPIFVGVATGPAIAGSDANVMEDFPVYCYKGKGDGSWRFTFEPQDMPKVSALASLVKTNCTSTAATTYVRNNSFI